MATAQEAPELNWQNTAECEVCGIEVNKNQRIGCEKCGRMFGPCCNSVEDNLCVECV